MFATLFLGTVLAVFLTLGAVRGDAERGLLQPLLVRPVRAARCCSAAGSAPPPSARAYVVVVFARRRSSPDALGGWWPDRMLVARCSRSRWRVAIIAALSLAGSVLLAATANGIAIFMLFGAGLTAGLLGQIARGARLQHAARRRERRELGAALRGALPGRARAS